MSVAPAARRATPNLLLITIDALRADHLGSYGSTQGLTPNLDAFARGATHYDAAYVAAPWTLPSFAAMFTSLPPSECGVKLPNAENTDWYAHRCRLARGTALVQERLQAAGYTTGAEITNIFLSPNRGWTRGHDYYRNESVGAMPPEVRAERIRAQNVTEHALDWLRLVGRRPFFLWVHHLDPHIPYDPPDTPGDVLAACPDHWVATRDVWEQEMQSADEDTRELYQHFCRRMYAEEVRYVDRWVGELLRGIRAAGIYDESLIIITADHGEELFEHGRLAHGHSMHEELLWVPLLVKWPAGLEADERVGQTVALTDLPATLLELAGAWPSAGLRGKPWPRCNGAGGAEVYSESILFGLEQTALTTERHKAICHMHGCAGGVLFEVYDRGEDRLETKPLPRERLPSDLCERLRERTAAAQSASCEWLPARSEPPALDPVSLDAMRALGYLGD